MDITINLLRTTNKIITKMKKHYLVALLALICNFAFAQLEQVTYRGAFAPSVPMWTDTWTNYDPGNTEYADAATVVNVSGVISANTTWTAGKTYKLTGLVYVTNNATLTIEPGVVVKGVSTSNGTALIITKGAKINAIGTASDPIVFTSAKTIEQVRLPGDWGGLILLGKAGFNVNGGVNNIEGITATANTEYGGGSTPNHADNSGTLKYVRIEYAGFVFSPNNEINGLTMGAVGSGTTIDYVQVSYANDDAFEWFGGSVNCKHLVSYRNLDDDFDTDNGYKGTVQFGLILRDPSKADNPAISTSEGFESDNNAGGTVSAAGLDATSATFSNITAIGPKARAALSPAVSVASGYEKALRIRRVSELKIINSIFMDFKKNYLFVDGATTVDNVKSLKLLFKNNIMAGSSDGDALFTGGVNFAGANGASVYTGLKLNNTGADISPNAWFTGNGNTVQSSSANLLELAYNATTSTYAGLDYRPKTDSPALSGADFTGFVSIAPEGSTPLAANLTFCKGTTPVALTATLRGTGTDLKFYSRTGTRAPYTYTLVTNGLITPSTVGEKTYYVTQMNGTTESAKDAVSMTVTVKALPTEVLTAITGTNPDSLTTTAAITGVSLYVGTSSSFTYTTSGITSPNTYLWTVPNGVNITNGQGTATITVNYANVPSGAGTLGTIGVQAVNADGCKNTAKTLTITKALPAAPATLALYNKNAEYATPNTAITNYSTYMGTSTALKLTAGAVATASAYEWELPAGVNLAIPVGTTPVTTTKTYTAEPFLSTNTPSTTIGTKFWTVTKSDYTFDVDGVSTTTSVSTAKQNIVGSGTYTFTVAAGAIGVNQVGTVFTYNGDTYILSTATTASSTSVACAVVFPLQGSNYPEKTITVSGSLTKVADNSTVAFTKITVVQARTYTFTIAAGQIGAKSVGTEFTYNGDTYYLSTATTSTSTSVVCYVANPQPAGNYPSAVTTNVNGVLTDALNATTTNFTKIVKAGYQATTSQSYAPYGTKIVSDKNAILVKFDGVTNQATTKLYLGVKSVNGVGSSVTNNATNADVVANTNVPGLFYTTYTETVTAPSASTLTNLGSVYNATGSSASTAKLLTLTAAAPAAPATLSAYAYTTDAITSTTAKVTDISRYIGMSTDLILVAATSALATSYKWELPVGANIKLNSATAVSGETNVYTSTLNRITVDFNNVGSGITSLYVGVKGVNTIGASSTTNSALTPATSSTYKLLKLSATVPAAATALVGDSTNLVCGATKDYSFTASVKAFGYTITAPSGSVVTTTDAPNNATSSVYTTTTAFTVTYPATFAITTATSVADKSLVIRASNGVGNNATNLTKTLTTAAFAGTIGAHSSTTTTTALAKFKTCQVKNITIPAFAGASSYVWTVANGAVITDTDQTTRVINVDFSALEASVTSTVVTVKALNSCGVSTAVKSITLTKENCTSATNKITEENQISLVSKTEMYPNPATDVVNFNIDATSNGVVELTIYSIDGKIVKESKGLNVENGTNSFTENVSNLNNGIYLVRITNSTSNEVITKRLIKN